LPGWLPSSRSWRQVCSVRFSWPWCWPIAPWQAAMPRTCRSEAGRRTVFSCSYLQSWVSGRRAEESNYSGKCPYRIGQGNAGGLRPLHDGPVVTVARTVVQLAFVLDRPPLHGLSLRQDCRGFVHFAELRRERLHDGLDLIGMD